MSMAATLPSVSSLSFARSDSNAVGLHSSLMDKARDNAPRIVGAMKLVGDITMGMTGNPFLIAYGLLSGIGRILVMLYGSKENQRQVAEEQKTNPAAQVTETGIEGGIKKVLRPREYPVEASAGLSMLGEMGTVAFGLSQFADGGTGFTPTLLGTFAVWSYGNILFGKEKNKDEKDTQTKAAIGSLTFTKSESKPVGFIDSMRTMMKGNPVLVSSVLNTIIGTGMLIGGLTEGMPFMFLVASVVGTLANVVQGILVRKNEFNIEGAHAQKAVSETHPTSFEARYKNGGNEPGWQRT